MIEKWLTLVLVGHDFLHFLGGLLYTKSIQIFCKKNITTLHSNTPKVMSRLSSSQMVTVSLASVSFSPGFPMFPGSRLRHVSCCRPRGAGCVPSPGHFAAPRVRCAISAPRPSTDGHLSWKTWMFQCVNGRSSGSNRWRYWLYHIRPYFVGIFLKWPLNMFQCRCFDTFWHKMFTILACDNDDLEVHMKWDILACWLGRGKSISELLPVNLSHQCNGWSTATDIFGRREIHRHLNRVRVHNTPVSSKVLWRSFFAECIHRGLHVLRPAFGLMVGCCVLVCWLAKLSGLNISIIARRSLQFFHVQKDVLNQKCQHRHERCKTRLF